MSALRCHLCRRSHLRVVGEEESRHVRAKLLAGPGRVRYHQYGTSGGRVDLDSESVVHY